MSDGYPVRARWWCPPRPAGAVLYLHGIQSHGGWFEGSAGHLAARGLAVLLPDRRGSGLNEQDRGHAPSARRLLLDTSEAADWVLQQTGHARVHLVGVSWGAKLALGMQLRRPEVIESISLVAPGLFPRVDMRARTKLAIAWCRLVRAREEFAIPLNEPELFTANPERAAFIEADELRLMRATAGFFVASRYLDLLVRRVRPAARSRLRLYLAGTDHIIDNARTAAWARALPWPQRTITQYDGTSHTLEFEPAPQTFFDDLAGGMLS